MSKAQIKANKMYRHKIRAMTIKMLGGKCVKCGFNDFRALQIDHVNGHGSKELKSVSSRSNYYFQILKKIKEGCKDFQLLCANCNWIKRVENKEYL